MRRLSVLAGVVMSIAVPCAAQPVDEPLPRFAADLHGLWGGLPSSSGWVPQVPTDTPLPTRAFGVSWGAHVYLFRLGMATFGAGVSGSFLQGKGNPADRLAASSTTTATVTTRIPVVTTKVTSLLPQLSMNFGHRFGWSYVSAGYGPTRIESHAGAVGTLPATFAPDRWNPAINFGGGARWFMKRHLGAAFDLRFTKLSSRATTATSPGAKRTQVVNLLVGISVQ